MILLIDNYDSFTYNIVQYVGELGVTVCVKRNDEITLDDIKQMSPSKIIISPGPCTPNEAGISVDLIREFQNKLPIIALNQLNILNMLSDNSNPGKDLLYIKYLY